MTDGAVLRSALDALRSAVEDLRVFGREEKDTALVGKDREQYQFWGGWLSALDRVDAALLTAWPAPSSSEIETLRKERDDAQRDVILMAQSLVGAKCEHHTWPLDVLEYLAIRECPICWKACAEEASRELQALKAAWPAPQLQEKEEEAKSDPRDPPTGARS